MSFSSRLLKTEESTGFHKLDVCDLQAGNWPTDSKKNGLRSFSALELREDVWKLCPILLGREGRYVSMFLFLGDDSGRSLVFVASWGAERGELSSFAVIGPTTDMDFAL